MKNEEEACINYANEVIFHQKQTYTQLNYYLRFENFTSKILRKIHFTVR